ncbi:MAG: nuclear transport factor 2 family protein [Deltaproteobacteria bacterium]|jgi:uncharacterized protein (TIGR02246 family)|nr:nuclear transport factor 2 family protein [Deltaproteobacteria bacterium]MBW2500507.1 nuclear transport factor 2 family protein [Deltaproteobacteria bacterium]
MSLTTDDQIEIQQLYARYNTAIDTGDGKGFAACFVADGSFDPGTGSALSGREAFAGFAQQTHESLPGLRHNATNIVIEGGGDRATGSAFLIAYLVDGGFKVMTTGRYRDELTRTAEGWRFTKRIYKPDA